MSDDLKPNEHCELCGKPIHYTQPFFRDMQYGRTVPEGAPDWYYHFYGLPSKVCGNCENKIRKQWERDFVKEKVWYDCSRCNGTGKVKGYTCVSCGGKKGDYYEKNVYRGKKQ